LILLIFSSRLTKSGRAFARGNFVRRSVTPMRQINNPLLTNFYSTISQTVLFYL